MREIKFRAYHTQQGKMYSAEEMASDQLTLLTTGSFINVSGDSTRLSKIYPQDKFIPLQYTGLKDENGKEIYEGDIIQSTSNFLSWETGIETGKICIETYQVIYVEEESHFTTQAIKALSQVGYVNKLGMSQKQMDKYYKVIGNIYENPELLKEEQDE